MRDVLVAVVVSFWVVTISAACALQQKQVERELSAAGPVDCSTAHGDLRLLYHEKASVRANKSILQYHPLLSPSAEIFCSCPCAREEGMRAVSGGPFGAVVVKIGEIDGYSPNSAVGGIADAPDGHPAPPPTTRSDHPHLHRERRLTGQPV